MVRGVLPPAGPPALVDAAVCTAFAVMPFGQYLVAYQLDVGLLFVAAGTALATAALVTQRPIWRGLATAAHVAWQHVPSAAAVAVVVVTTGSLRVQEIAHAQGGWPWEWLAFRSPASLASVVLLLACAFIEPNEAPPAGALTAHVETLDERRPPPRGLWLEAACRGHRLAVAGLASLLFLGGWVLPGLSPAAQDGRPVLELAGAAWLLAKMWGLALLMTCLRRALPRRTPAQRSRFVAFVVAPAAAGLLGVTTFWTWWSVPGAAQALLSRALVAVALLGGLAVLHRVRHGLAAAPEGRLSPFL
jgi:NADH-quinone oxidoreductase subunit H